MAKRKEKNPEEYYKGIIRQLEKRIRQLESELKFYRNQFESTILVRKSEKNIEKKVDKKEILCHSCAKANLNLVDILGRQFLVCPVCKARKKLNDTKKT